MSRNDPDTIERTEFSSQASEAPASGLEHAPANDPSTNEFGLGVDEGVASNHWHLRREVDWHFAGRTWGTAAVAIVGITAAFFAAVNWKPSPPVEWNPEAPVNGQQTASVSPSAPAQLLGVVAAGAEAQPAGDQGGASDSLGDPTEALGARDLALATAEDVLETLGFGTQAAAPMVRPTAVLAEATRPATASSAPAPKSEVVTVPSTPAPAPTSAPASVPAAAAAAPAPAPAPVPSQAQTPALAQALASAAPTVALTAVRENRADDLVRTPAKWIKGGPTDADNRRGRLKGSVVVRFTVQPEGRVADCVAVRGSGNAELDAKTCRIVEERASFSPAIDAQGRPIATTAQATYVWGRKRSRRWGWPF